MKKAKKFLALFLSILICLSAMNSVAFAMDDDIRVVVEGRAVWFDQPPISINGRTLVPIRAVCEEIGAIVSWENSTSTMSITKDSITLSMKVGSNVMQINDGTAIQLEVPPKTYNGRTLLPIREVVEELGYNVNWSEKDRTIIIEEAGATVVSGLAGTTATAAQRWAVVSSVQQFDYRGEGIAYAYVQDDSLMITTPDRQLKLDMKYPELGDVISDVDGNFYVVWGRTNDTDNASVETTFISKYSPEGQHIKTTGFIGKSQPWRDSDSAKTKIPFDAGNCVSAIANGILVNYHAKQRYDGHQCDQAIAVRITDMSAYQLPNNTFSGHSFNQSLIYCKKTSDFLFASQGDAYARGFRINDKRGSYGDNKELLFHFYLEANANYNMYVVNETFAQLGNIAETSRGVALVGASVKSISEDAKTEKQNLFVQIFDPTADSVSPSMFVGGEMRKGATSFDINDNNNSPLTSVMDYGVHWLTDYTDMDAVAPQVVEADDRLVVLWTTRDAESSSYYNNFSAYYMVLSADGKVLTPATSLGRMPLNSYERPIYHNGSVYWVSVNNERLKVRSIKI